MAYVRGSNIANGGVEMRVIAHRGASGYAPENTRAAFERAIAMGADAIETDVRLSAGGQLVLMHDATVTRTTDGRGPVADHTLAELRSLDAGSWFSEAFAGERVPTLAELIADIVPRIPTVLEIKDQAATVPTIAAIRAAGIGNRVEVTSFLWPAVVEAKRLAPELTIGFLTPEFDEDIIRRCDRRDFAQVCPHVDSLTTELVATAHGAGLVVRAYGISRREQIDRLFATGADGATVNWPDWILERGRVP
jgi:glycerophosphoryl diester phosphodiesterase